MKKITLALSLVLSFQLHAFEETETGIVTEAENIYVVDNQWEWSISVTQTNFDNNVGFYGIEDSALGFSVDVDYIKSHWITTLSASYLAYDDNWEFNQEVVGKGFGNRGDRSNETSDASGVLLGAAIGRIHFFGEASDAAIYGQLGADFMVYSERSIGFCDDCYSEDIDVDGGVFLKVGFVKDTDIVNIGFHAKTYLRGDSIDTVFGISVGSTY